MSGNPSEGSQQSLVQRLSAWGEHSFPPTILASLIFAQHGRPFQLFPMLFTPALLFTSYANIQGFKTDAAGMNAAFSGLYLLLASRRRQTITQKFSPRGIVRGVTMGLCLANMIGGGLAYTLRKQDEEEEV